MIYVFLAAPYDGSGTQAQNVSRALEVAAQLLDQGFAVYVPHLSHFADIVTPLPRSRWVAHSLAWLERCDVVLRLPGESPGADAEVARAEELRKPVFYSISELREAWVLWQMPRTAPVIGEQQP